MTPAFWIERLFRIYTECKGISMPPSGTAVVLCMVCMGLGLGQSSESEVIQRYREDLQRHPSNAFAHFRLGELFFEQHNGQAAANEFRKALEGDPHPRWIDAWAHINIGEIFDQSGQRSRALQEYRLAEQTRDDTEGAQAVIAQRLQEPSKADDASFHRILVSYRSAPEPVVKAHPDYTPEARLAELEGTATVAATVGADGRVKDVRVVRPLGLGLDEAAEAAARKSTFEPSVTENGPAPMLTTIDSDFLLPSKQSHWHLLRVLFKNPEGMSRPHFVKTVYPVRDGVSPRAIDDARLVAAMGRQAFVILSFEIDLAGRPVRFRVDRATGPVWGGEAIAIVQQWRFIPGRKDHGTAIEAPCTLTLVWGERVFTPGSLAWAREALESSPAPETDR